nr:MAG TPA: hypothetical protein [Caudoviricetes sp.]
MKGGSCVPRRNKHGRKRYKGAAIVDPELQNILQKHAKEEQKWHECKEVDEEWEALRRKLKEQKRQQHEAQCLKDEGMSLTIVFTTCGAVLSLIVMAMILILWGR